MQEGSVVAHGVVGVQHWRQHFVVNVQRRQSLFRCARRRCRNRGDGVADVQRLLPCHHVAAVKPVVDRRALFLVCDLSRDIGEVGRGNYGLYAGDGQSAGGVYAPDDCVGVRAAQYLANQPARRVNVGGVARAARHLVWPVVSYGSGADDVELTITQHDVGLFSCHKQLLVLFDECLHKHK